MSDMIQAKGTNFMYAREYITKTYGEAFFNSLIENMSAETVASWKHAIPISFYPFSHFKELTHYLAQEKLVSSDEEM